MLNDNLLMQNIILAELLHFRICVIIKQSLKNLLLIFDQIKTAMATTLIFLRYNVNAIFF